MNTRIVVLHGFEEEAMLAVMRAVKGALPDPGSVAFASTTPTNLEWKVGDLVEHIGEEHAAWKARSGQA